MADDRPSRSLDKFVLRLPEGLREKLATRAKVRGRSMNGEAVEILEAALSASEDTSLMMLKLELAALREHEMGLKDQLQGVVERRARVQDEIQSMLDLTLMPDDERARHEADVRGVEPRDQAE